MSSRIPDYRDVIEGTTARRPGESTQVGCVWCLKENVDAPASFGIIYYWGGTSTCGRHLKLLFDNQGT